MMEGGAALLYLSLASHFVSLSFFLCPLTAVSVHPTPFSHHFCSPLSTSLSICDPPSQYTDVIASPETFREDWKRYARIDWYLYNVCMYIMCISNVYM